MVRVTFKRKLLAVAAAILVAICLCPGAYAAPKYRVLHDFTGSDGSGPYSGVTVGQNGDLYGTTAGGGTGDCSGGCGTVFELTPQPSGKWVEAVLYSFNYDSGRDGAGPRANLIFDRSGSLYGTTASGGDHNSGVVFELTPTEGGWEETVVYNFCTLQNCDDGGSPTAGLIMDQSGSLYGTAQAVFELSHGSDGWDETVIHHFTGQRNGAGADSGLIFDASGNLYGVAEEGGNCYSCGVVFEVTPTSQGGWKEVVLHRFDNNGKDGYGPGGGALVMGGSGNLYGTTEVGGAYRYGTVFKLAPGSDGHWKETIIHDFKNNKGGSLPTSGVVSDNAGNLYGMAGGGGSCDCGVVYKLAPGSKGKWTYTVLHRFSGIDGAIPAGSLTLDKKGNLYGGTVLGGPTDNGVIFELTP
jgi:uncharacterized repeat protein (TIGR03803 family)